MEEELDDIETRLEASPKKSLCLLALQCGLAKVQLMSQSCYSCGLRKLQSYVSFCLQIAIQEFLTVCGFRNQYSYGLLGPERNV